MKSIKQFLTSNFPRTRHIKVNVESDDKDRIIQIEPKDKTEKTDSDIIKTNSKDTMQSPKSQIYKTV